MNPLILGGHEVAPEVVALKAISGITAGLGVSCTLPPPLLLPSPELPNL